MIGRFTQEDTYRGDGLNLYAYCAGNPVYYVDPSGHELCANGANEIKKLLSEGKLNEEELSKLKAYLKERQESGKINLHEEELANYLANNPYYWSNEKLQQCMDEIYLAGIKDLWYKEVNKQKGRGSHKKVKLWDDGPRQSITIVPDGTVIISQNKGAVNQKSLMVAKQKFESVIHLSSANGDRRPGMKDSFGNHSETRAIYWLERSEKYTTIGAKQISSHNSCPSCEKVQNETKINNITGLASKEGKQKRLDYVKILKLDPKVLCV